MTTRTLILALVGLTGLCTLLTLAYLSQQSLVRGLPGRTICKSSHQAALLAGLDAHPVLGTGSMYPFIPHTPFGTDPRTTVVAYAVVSPVIKYPSITPGALCIYRPTWAANLPYTVIHQAAQYDSAGWIMTGLNNSRSETNERMTPSKFVGVVTHIYVIQPE